MEKSNLLNNFIEYGQINSKIVFLSNDLEYFGEIKMNFGKMLGGLQTVAGGLIFLGAAWYLFDPAFNPEVDGLGDGSSTELKGSRARRSGGLVLMVGRILESFGGLKLVFGVCLLLGLVICWIGIREMMGKEEDQPEEA